jgi:hypothetical protein
MWKKLKLDMFQFFLNNIHEYCDAPRPWGVSLKCGKPYSLFLNHYSCSKSTPGSSFKNLTEISGDESKGNYISGLIYDSQKALVIWGTNLTSTVGVKFTRTQLAMVQLAPYQYNVIIG